MSEEIIDYTGGCFCGNVRYHVLGKPIHITHCHCSMCRQACGAAFVTWVIFSRANFSFTKGAPSRFKSSEKVERSFCNYCGTALTFEETSRPDQVDVTIGSLDEPNNLSPEEHIWTSSRLSWLHMNDGLPEYPQASPRESKS